MYKIGSVCGGCVGGYLIWIARECFTINDDKKRVQTFLEKWEILGKYSNKFGEILSIIFNF